KARRCPSTNPRAATAGEGSRTENSAVRPSAGGRVLPNPRFSGAAKKASCDRQLAHFRPVFTRIPADPHVELLQQWLPLDLDLHSRGVRLGGVQRPDKG